MVELFVKTIVRIPEALLQRALLGFMIYFNLCTGNAKAAQAESRRYEVKFELMCKSLHQV